MPFVELEEVAAVDELVSLLGETGGGGILPELIRLARSCSTLVAADCAVVVSPDWTALKSELRSVRNWLLPEVAPLADDESEVDELVLELPDDDVPNKVCRSFETAVAALCVPVVSPD